MLRTWVCPHHSVMQLVPYNMTCCFAHWETDLFSYFYLDVFPFLDDIAIEASSTKEVYDSEKIALSKGYHFSETQTHKLSLIFLVSIVKTYLITNSSDLWNQICKNETHLLRFPGWVFSTNLSQTLDSTWEAFCSRMCLQQGPESRD